MKRFGSLVLVLKGLHHQVLLGCCSHTSLNQTQDGAVQPRDSRGRFVSRSILTSLAVSLLFLTSFVTAVDQPRPRADSTKQKQLGMEMLRRAVALAREANVSDAAQLLALAGHAVRASNSALAKTYYLRALDMTDNMPLNSPNNLRVSIQNSTVAGIASNDPMLAMQLFRRIDKPDWTAFPEIDMRYVAASAIVQSIVAKTGTSKADNLAELFVYAGETGEYPYNSASTLLSALEERQQKDLISEIFSDALRHIQKDKTFASGPGDFTDLLLSHSNSLPPSLCIAGIQAAVQTARFFDGKQKGDANTEQRTMVLDTGKSQLAISKQATYIALRLLPLASRLDNDVAEDLKHYDSDLQAATAGASNDELANLTSGRISVLVGEGGVASAQVGNIMHDQAESQRLEELSQRDPEKAIAGLSGVQDAETKVRTQAAIAQNLIHSDPARAAAMLESARNDSAKIKDIKEHVVVLEIIADVWSKLNDREHVRSIVSEGLSLAQKMYSASKDQKVDMFLWRPGVDEFGELAGLLARVDPQGSTVLVQSVDSPEAKAYVLLSIAHALLELRVPDQNNS
jgi:hypothetical protein